MQYQSNLYDSLMAFKVRQAYSVLLIDHTSKWSLLMSPIELFMSLYVNNSPYYPCNLILINCCCATQMF